MNILSPAWGWMAALAVPIVLLYMLKLRRQEAPVSSIMLWQALLRDRQANTPWQKLRRNILLILQLLVLMGLVAALVRPAFPVPTIAAGSVVVMLDASASMNATDVTPSRFEAAKQAARTLINNLDRGSVMTLVLVSSQPETLIAASSDRDALRRSVDSAQPSFTHADWEAAFALAAGAAGASQKTTIVIVSDGGLPESNLPTLPGKVRYVPIGESGRNLAISAFALRPSGVGADMFSSVTNYGLQDEAVLFSLYRDGQLFDARRLDIPAGESRDVVYEGLPNAPADYEARLSPSGSELEQVDVLAVDNAAFAAYQPQNDGETLLVTRGNFFLEQLLTTLPKIIPFRALPGENGSLQLPQRRFDVYVFDSITPAEIPNGNILLINPESNALFEVTGLSKDFTGVKTADHPLMEYVDWSAIRLLQARQVVLPEWATVLVGTQDTPLVFIGETDGRRVAVLTFDLLDSDLPLQIAFPILFNNLLNYLNPGLPFDAPNGLVPGDALLIQPNGEVTEITLDMPNGESLPLELTEAGALVTNTGEVGFYTVHVRTPSRRDRYSFAVNLFDPSESDIHPAENIHVGSSRLDASDQTEVGQRELWPWLAAAALIILMLEWWVYHRRQLPPAGAVPPKHMRRPRSA
ncbi:MAG: BatA and WFA domain-containing protein [Anaerolineae bacterium]|nr:BatA and WFA domain-containing protein [Anaerolineae bacterium]